MQKTVQKSTNNPFKRLWKFISTHTLEIGASCGIIFDIYVLLEIIILKTVPDSYELLICVTITALYFCACFISIQCEILKDAMKLIFEQNLYFHGFEIGHYIANGALKRFSDWLNIDISCELSVLAMIALKQFKFARRCSGIYTDNDSCLPKDHRHNWVEFKIPLNGWWVADFELCPCGFRKKSQYFREIKKEGNSLEQSGSCSYNEFWQTKFANELYEAMREQSTSGVLKPLTKACRNGTLFGFSDEYRDDSTPIDTSDKPWLFTDDTLLSTPIIQDFVKNPKRRQPTKRSLRKTFSIMRKDS